MNEDYKAQMVADIGGAVYAILIFVAIILNCWPLIYTLVVIGAIILLSGIIVCAID